MSDLMRFPTAVRHDPEVDAWLASPHHELRRMAEPWFERMRALGEDVRELMHDHCPTACVEDAAFAYVAAFKAHVNIGFFQGASLADPHGLLEGSGKRMRHVKLHWGRRPDEAAIAALIDAAYADMRARVAAEP
ncbi:MAG: DUF1801 domain-containing protein [Proteobacteria bacterium]|nr:DUF1801 domain-containing protein [Pseudomonadota bacterium]